MDDDANVYIESEITVYMMCVCVSVCVNTYAYMYVWELYKVWPESKARIPRHSRRTLMSCCNNITSECRLELW